MSIPRPRITRTAFDLFGHAPPDLTPPAGFEPATVGLEVQPEGVQRRRIRHEGLDPVQGVRLSSLESGTNFGTEFLRACRCYRGPSGGGIPSCLQIARANGKPISRCRGTEVDRSASIPQ
jgi:hypothetical protein